MHPNGQDPDINLVDEDDLPLPDGPLTACFEQFEYCQLLPSMYNVTEDGSRFWCSECITGYAWNFEDEECQECSDVFDDCNACTWEGCSECDDGFVVGGDGECYEEYADCAHHSWDEDFGLYCDQCDAGLFFIAYALDTSNTVVTPACIDCDDEAWGIEFCESCSTVVIEIQDDDNLIYRVCDACEGGYTPSPS